MLFNSGIIYVVWDDVLLDLSDVIDLNNFINIDKFISLIDFIFDFFVKFNVIRLINGLELSCGIFNDYWFVEKGLILVIDLLIYLRVDG